MHFPQVDVYFLLFLLQPAQETEVSTARASHMHAGFLVLNDSITAWAPSEHKLAFLVHTFKPC